LTELVHYFNKRCQFAPGRAEALRLDFCGGRVRARFGDRTLDSVFQPLIERASGGVIGHEAHLRVVAGEGQALPSQAVFLEAHDDEELVRLDRLVRTLHALNFLLQREQAGGILALNVHPQLIRAVPERHGHVFETVLSRCGLTPERVALEITDDGFADPEHLANAIAEYQARGYRITLDNFGRHSTDLERLATLAPDIVKLDRSLSGHAGHLALARRVLEGLVPEIRHLGMTIASQHIETAEQLQLAESLGVDWLQGHLLGRPASECKPVRKWRNVRAAA
jgi:EAL domain-containing protein (putative c-di-GMP-specific phosphodiesterase class I)